MGDKLDVRDTEYIWCTAVVKLKIECVNRPPVLAVHYEGWNNYYDEFLATNSQRVAKLGTYTKRTDIPKYQLRNQNSM